MRKLFHFQFIATIFSMIFFCMGCKSDPVASFTATTTSVTEGESVQFTDLSENDPNRWFWEFEGGTPSSSQLQNPYITYNTAGTYSVTLEVGKLGGDNMMTRDNYINVLPATTDLTFINNTYTEVLVEVSGMTKTVASGEQVTYFDIEGNSVDYAAETSGKTSGGNLLGLELYWDYTIPLDGGSQDYELDVGTAFFFLYITNDGTHVLSPMEIDHGDTETITENVAIPTDGVKYSTGYYRAWEFAQVRAYWEDQPDQYTYWDHNDQFTYPNEMNQNISLSNSFKKGVIADADQIPVKRDIQYLRPSGNYEPVKTTKEGIIRHFPNR